MKYETKSSQHLSFIRSEYFKQPPVCLWGLKEVGASEVLLTVCTYSRITIRPQSIHRGGTGKHCGEF